MIDLLTVLVMFAGYFFIAAFLAVLILAVKIHRDDRRRLRPFDWDPNAELAALLRERARTGS